MFQTAVGIVKSKGKSDKWKELTFQGTALACMPATAYIHTRLSVSSV